MKLMALITTLVLGSSSVAMAQPVVREHHVPMMEDTNPQPVPLYRPAPQPEPIYQPAPKPPVYQPIPKPPAYRPIPKPIFQPPARRPAWVTLGGVNHSVEGEMSFRVSRFAAPFSKLKLQSDAGRSLIHRVLIRFTNGRTQVVELNQYLNARNPVITIDLRGRERSIAKVTVVGRNARRSAYRVLAI